MSRPPRRLGPQRQRETRQQREARRDREALAALEAAEGICERCEMPSPALKTVRVDSDQGATWAVQCIDPFRCREQIRESVTGEVA